MRRNLESLNGSEVVINNNKKAKVSANCYLFTIN
jgi:hypothetical protein